MSNLQHVFDPIPQWLPFILTGLGMTLVLASGSLLLGLVIGGLGATMKVSSNPLLRILMQLYTTIVRSVPELIVVYYFYFGMNEGLKLLRGFPGLPSPLQMPVIVIAFLSLGFIAGALAVELFRTAYSAVPQSEVLAAKAFAMPRFMLFRRILFPHMVRYSLPGLGNIWIGLLKESSLISIMGVTELMRATTLAANSTGEPFTFYLLCTAIYLVVALISGGVFAWLERRYTV